MNGYIAAHKDNPKFVVFCDSYGVRLLECGWNLYTDGGGVDELMIAEKVRSENRELNMRNKYEIDKMNMQLEQYKLEITRQKEQIKLESKNEVDRFKLESKNEVDRLSQQLEQYKLEITRQKEQIRLESKNEIDRFKLESKNEVDRLTALNEQYKLEIDRSKLESKNEVDRQIEQIRLESKNEVDRLIALNEQYKLELEKPNREAAALIEQTKLECRHQIQLLESKKESELIAAKLQSDTILYKYATEATASYAVLSAENKQLKENSTLNEILAKLCISKGANSAQKGDAGQTLVETILGDLYYTGAKMVKCNDTPHSCDINFIWHILKAKIEVKNYDRAIHTDEITKFRNDMRKSKSNGFNCGIFVSIDQGTMGEYNNLGYEWLDGLLLIYFNLNRAAANMRYAINLAMIVMENKVEAGDDNETILIQSFKDNYLSIETSIGVNDKLIKQTAQSLKILEGERTRLNETKEKMLKIGPSWISTNVTPVMDASELKVPDMDIDQLMILAYDHIIKYGGSGVSPAPVIEKFFGGKGVDLTAVLYKLADRAVYEAFLPGTFEYFMKENLAMTHVALQNTTIPGKGKIFNKAKYALIGRFGDRPLNLTVQCYERWKRGRLVS
jgi:hypothetical protein